MEKIFRPFRISPSSINTFEKCSLQFKLRYIDEFNVDTETDNLYAVRGSAFHKIMQLHDMYSFLDEKTLIEYWPFLFYNYEVECENLPKNRQTKTFIKEGYSLIRNGLELKKRWSHCKIIGNEKYVRLKYENKFIDQVFLSGKIDLVLLEDGTYTILDWKTSKRTDEDIDNNLQMSIYIYFIHKIYNVKYKNIFGALAYPFKKDILFTQRTEKEINEVFNRINNMLLRIAKSDFRKDPKEGWQPNDCTFCPYIDSCDKL